MMNILGLIPARAGSKRIRGKNIVSLAGKPLIAYTLEAARKSRLIQRVFVSTDSPEIASVSESFGFKVPSLRPAEISGDDSLEIDFYRHALVTLKNDDKYVPDLIVTLYPTAPFRTAESIDRAIEKMLADDEADSLRSVKLCSEHPQKMWREESGYLTPYVSNPDGNAQTLSYHLLPAVYIQNANIYITRPATLNRFGSPIGNKVLSFVMNEQESLDINTPMDLKLAELICREKHARA